MDNHDQGEDGGGRHIEAATTGAGAAAGAAGIAGNEGGDAGTSASAQGTGDAPPLPPAETHAAPPPDTGGDSEGGMTLHVKSMNESSFTVTGVRPDMDVEELKAM